MEILLLWIVLLSLVFGYYAEYKRRGADSGVLTIWKYFSYYTILTNLLVLFWLAVKVFFPESTFAIFLFNSNVSAAIIFYIFTVGIANYLLYGWQKLTLLYRIYDLLVHVVTPILTFLYWLLYVDKTQLDYAYILYWLIYPLGYALYTALHGVWTKFYPYDFTNVELYGAKKVAKTALFLSVCLFLGAAAFVFMGSTIA